MAVGHGVARVLNTEEARVRRDVSGQLIRGAQRDDELVGGHHDGDGVVEAEVELEPLGRGGETAVDQGECLADFFRVPVSV